MFFNDKVKYQLFIVTSSGIAHGQGKYVLEPWCDTELHIKRGKTLNKQQEKIPIFYIFI